MNIFIILKINVLSILKIINLLIHGVSLKSPFTTMIIGELKVGKNVIIGKNVKFEGVIEIENDVIIEDHCSIVDAFLSKKSHIKSYSIIEGSRIGRNSFIGPYARIRGNTIVQNRCQIGNFVELKNSSIGSGSRINHMAFIGDAIIEKNVTIGAGTITCNHDGKKVNKTLVKENAYIGSNVNLIAPLTIDSHATIGSGSTITNDAPKNQLTLARSRQVTIENWNGPKTNEKKEE